MQTRINTLFCSTTKTKRDKGIQCGVRQVIEENHVGPKKHSREQALVAAFCNVQLEPEYLANRKMP